MPFALQGGTEPQDWFFAQRYPSFFSSNTTGSFTLEVMDNGDDRAFPDGTNRLTQSYRCYTTIPVMQVDEIGKTAAISWRQTLPSNFYSSFAGYTFPLANGNVEYNLAGVDSDAYVFEVTKRRPRRQSGRCISRERTLTAPFVCPACTQGCSGKAAVAIALSRREAHRLTPDPKNAFQGVVMERVALKAYTGTGRTTENSMVCSSE